MYAFGAASWSGPRTRLVLAVLVVMPSGSGASANACAGAVKQLWLKSPSSLAAMAFASGKMLPFDAGKFHICEGLKRRVPPISTKFFTLTLKVSVGSVSIPSELGLCLPAACRNDDFHGESVHVANIIGNVTGQHPGPAIIVPKYALGYPQPKDTVPHPNPTNPTDDLAPWNAGATAAVSVVVCLLLWTALSTTVVLWARHTHQSQLVMEAQRSRGTSMGFIHSNPTSLSQPATLQQASSWLVIEAWSLVGRKGTWTDLSKCPPYKPTDCLNGMRVLSMLWIVLGHSFLISQTNAGFGNSEDIKKTPLTPDAAETTWKLQFIFGADMGVDTFFYISGFLLSYIAKARKSPVVLGTVLRYFRLVPSMAFMMLIYGWISPYLVHGPFASRVQQSILRKCTKNWWSNILFTMNFYPRDPAELCAGWTWYLGNDFIFAFVGLVLMNFWKSCPKAAWSWVVLLTASSFLMSMIVGQRLGLGVYIFLQGRDYTYNLYSNPLHRIPAFLVGLVLPWLLDVLDRRGMGRDPTAPKTLTARLVWICAAMASVVVMLICVLLPSTDFPGGSGSSRQAMNWSTTASVLFFTLVHPVWASAVGLITVACYYGYLPLFNRVLSHWLWHPLVKLTFGAYLLHPIVIKTLAGNMVSYFNFSMSEVLMHAFAHCSLAYAAATVMWCLVERPFQTLTEAAVPKRRPQVAQPIDPKPAIDPTASVFSSSHSRTNENVWA